MSEKRMAGLNSASMPPSLRKSPVRYTRSSVLKMLAVMEQTQQTNYNSGAGSTATPDEPNNGHVSDFLTSGRTGRRNALPDILSEHAHVTSSDLPARLEALSTKDTNYQKGASTSKQASKPEANNATPSTSSSEN